MAKNNKTWIAWLSLIILAWLLLLIHLQYDDELDSEAQKWQHYYAAPTELEDNAHLALIGLSNDDTSYNDRFAKGKRLYLQAKEITELGNLKALKYPQVNELFELQDHELLCDLHQSDCIDLLDANKEHVKTLLEQFRPLISQYLDLAASPNFAFINAFVSRPDITQLMTISRLIALDAYMAIQAQNVDHAASNLAKLMIIDRKFASNSVEMLFYIAPIVNSEIIYAPLIQMLLEKGFTDWSVLSYGLQALTIDEISMNRFELAQFAYWSPLMKFEQIVEKQWGPSVFIQIAGRFIYKDNMTINKMYSVAKSRLLPVNVEKGTLLNAIEILDYNQDQLEEKHQAVLDNKVWYLIKNYRNFVGAVMALTGSPRKINLYNDAVAYDLRLQLLRLKIAASKRALNDVIDEPQFINPYNGKKPFIQNEKMCYQMSELLCVSII